MYTSLDVIEYLMSTTGGGAQDQEHRVLRQALFHAYRDLVTARDWRWYHTVEEVELSQSADLTVITLPWGCQSVDSVQLQQPAMLAEYLNPVEFERIVNTPNRQLTSLVWTVSPSKFSPDRFDLRILNGYQFISDVTLTYRRRPRDLICTGWEPGNRVGTVAWSNGEVTGVGTSFSNQMLGCILRVSGDESHHPESLAGMRPYKDEGLIYRVANPNSLYAWSPASGVSYPSTKYVITDYLDISPGMYTALLSGSEMWLSRLTGKNIEGAIGLYGRDLRLAFESDAMASLSGRKGGQGWYYSWWYLRPGADQGTGGGGTGGPNANGTCPLKPDVTGGNASDPGLGFWDGGSADTAFGACG